MIAAIAIAVSSLGAALFYIEADNQAGFLHILPLFYLILIPMLVSAGLKSMTPVLPRSVITLVSLSIFLLIFENENFYSFIRSLILIQAQDVSLHAKLLGQVFSSTAVVLSVLIMMVGAVQLGSQIIVPKADTNIVAVINSITPALLIFAVGISLQFIASFLNDAYLISGVQ